MNAYTDILSAINNIAPASNLIPTFSIVSLVISGIALIVVTTLQEKGHWDL